MHSKVTPNRKLRGTACVQYHVLPPPATRGACELLLPVHVPIGVAHLHGLAVGDRNGALRDEQRLLRHEELLLLLRVVVVAAAAAPLDERDGGLRRNRS